MYIFTLFEKSDCPVAGNNGDAPHQLRQWPLWLRFICIFSGGSVLLSELTKEGGEERVKKWALSRPHTSCRHSHLPLSLIQRAEGQGEVSASCQGQTTKSSHALVDRLQRWLRHPSHENTEERQPADLDWTSWSEFKKKLRLGLFRLRPVEQNKVFWMYWGGAC